MFAYTLAEVYWVLLALLIGFGCLLVAAIKAAFNNPVSKVVGKAAATSLFNRLLK